jgi:hypothetical protein
MKRPAADALREALRAIASLISKSEKTQRKLTPGTWPHTMLRDNLNALRLASALMSKGPRDADGFAPDDLRKARRGCAAMIGKSERALAKFPPGTSPHTLLRNRLKALRMAETFIRACLQK